jgi:8-oxo-dGTP diphosphatase
VLILGDKLREVHFPGGKIQEGELDLVESLKREVREETSFEISVGEPFATWTYSFTENHRLAGKNLFLVAYECEYISGEVTLSHEHDNFSWVTKDNYLEFDDNTPAFEILKKYFNR